MQKTKAGPCAGSQAFQKVLKLNIPMLVPRIDDLTFQRLAATNGWGEQAEPFTRNSGTHSRHFPGDHPLKVDRERRVQQTADLFRKTALVIDLPEFARTHSGHWFKDTQVVLLTFEDGAKQVLWIVRFHRCLRFFRNGAGQNGWHGMIGARVDGCGISIEVADSSQTSEAGKALFVYFMLCVQQ